MQTTDYFFLQPSTLETESEEYRSHNDTESDLEIQEKGMVIIKDVNMVRWISAALKTVHHSDTPLI